MYCAMGSVSIVDNKFLKHHTQTILESMNAITWEFDIKNQQLIYDSRFFDMLGYSEKDFVPFTLEKWDKLIHPDDLSKEKAVFKKVYNNVTKIYKSEIRIRHKEGDYKWFLDSGQIVSWSKEGVPLYAVGTLIDITKSKQIIQKTIDQDNRLNHIMKYSKDIIYQLDTEGRILFLSNSWQDLLKYKVNDSLGEFITKYIHPNDLKYVKNVVRKIRNQEIKAYKVKFQMVDKSNHPRYFETTLQPTLKNHKISGYVGILKDIDALVHKQKHLEAHSSELDRFFRVTVDLFSIVTKEGYFKKLNQSWCDLLGFSINELKSKPLTHFIHPQDLEKTKEAIDKIINQNTHVASFVNRYRTKQGFYKYLEWNATLFDDVIYASARDITTNKRMQKALFEEKEHLKTTLLSVGDGVITTDEHGIVEMLNPVAEKLTGYGYDYAVGRKFDKIFNVIDNKTSQPIGNIANEVMHTKNSKELQDVSLINKQGDIIPIDDSAAPIMDDKKNVFGSVIVFKDKTEEVKKQRQIEYLSYHDQLTGYFNRHYLSKIEPELKAKHNYPLCFISIDLNELKHINDNYGHVVGDEAIKVSSLLIKENIPNHDYIFRMGGDEFLLILPNTKDEDAYRIRENIKLAFESFDSIDYPLSIAYGYNTIYEPFNDLFEAIKVADHLMYKNKMKIKNQ